MRITGGALAGRKLRGPRGGVRPTSERVREALFAILKSLDGARVLDLCAGTGALGLEALSRGASHVVFIERDRKALATLRKNLAVAGVGDGDGSGDGDSCRIIAADVEVAVRRRLGGETPFDLALLDPPYRAAAALVPRVLGALARARLLAPGARVVVESDRRQPPTAPPAFARGDERRYGDTLLTFYRLTQEA